MGVQFASDQLAEQVIGTVPEPRRVTLLGATGSIGSSTADLIRRNRALYPVEAVAGGRDGRKLGELARDLGARFAAVADDAAYADLKDALAGSGIEAAAGQGAVIEAALRPADWTLGAIAGAAGLEPTLAAVARGQMVALANKECLVCAGDLFMKKVAAAGATLLPVDSEHNALFQAMGAGRRADIETAIITASGGPFRTWEKARIDQATAADALKHPTWVMGPKVTIDSASLMNKGLELIEAHHLFSLPPQDLDVLVHPQSIVHGLIVYRDGSVVAEMAPADMRVPIAHCLAYPHRLDGPMKRLDLRAIGQLTFEAPDMDRFPALRLARAAMTDGGAAPTVLNAANEIAVAAFLAGAIRFGAIPVVVDATLEALSGAGFGAPASIADARFVDSAAREKATDVLRTLA
jgi:1-deoxy-D-xylulose-5-phosphate reductoisomerase